MSTADALLRRRIGSGRSPASAAVRLVRGPDGDPGWSRPGLIATAVIAGILVCWALTTSGDANAYYADGALAASKSWTAFLTNAADLSGYVSLDKGPLSDWMMGVSGRIFGFGSLSMLLPNALCGVAAVLLLHNVVRRTLGHREALLAALMLALTPVSVLMDRYNNPDALLALLLVAAAWALVRALESGRLRHVALCGACVGLAFNTKMLEAYLIVPALAVAFVIAARGSVRHRAGHLLAGAVAMVTVSVAWYGTMMLIPAASRPYAGDSANNSWFQLIVGANGLSRVTGGGRGGGPATPGAGGRGPFSEVLARGAGGRGPFSEVLGRGAGGRGPFSEVLARGAGGRGPFSEVLGRGAGGPVRGRVVAGGGGTGPLRLFGSGIEGQIAWLLPLALLGLLVMLWVTRRAPRTDHRRAVAILFGVWAITGFVVFSFSAGIFHSYYTSAIAPAVAALAAAGSITLADRGRRSAAAALILGAAVAGTAVLSFVILGRAPGFVPWLRWVIVAGGAVAALTLVAAAVSRRLSPRLTAPVVLGAGAVALLAGPAAYSIATVGHGQTGSSPTAGPASVVAGPGAGAPPRFGEASPAGAHPRPFEPGGGRPEGDHADLALVRYLERNRDGARYLAAATGSQTAAPIALSTRAPVITIGGFSGADPAPTVAQLAALVRTGQLRFVLLGGGYAGFGLPGRGTAMSFARTRWVQSHCQQMNVAPGALAYRCSRARSGD